MLPGGIASAQDTAAGDAAARADHRPGGSRPQAFVGVKNGAFTVAGKTFRFGGTNTYYLHQVSHYMIDAALNDAAAMSLSVVRAWAFADGQNVDRPLQPQPFTYDNAAFDSLDYAIYKAGQLGLRLVLALTNNWPDYGGHAAVRVVVLPGVAQRREQRLAGQSRQVLHRPQDQGLLPGLCPLCHAPA